MNLLMLCSPLKVSFVFLCLMKTGKETAGEREESADKLGQAECKVVV